MKQLSMRLPNDLHAELVRLAKHEKRSVHAEIL